MKIYLSGSIVGSYRAQNLIKVISDAGILFSYNPISFLKPDISNRAIRGTASAILTILTLPIRLILIASSSCIFVLPMNASLASLSEVIFARILRKRVIIDYYISQYDTLVNDRKMYAANSLRARWHLFMDRFFLKNADKIVFLNYAESEYYQKIAEINLKKDQFSIIPLCIDYKKELFSPQNHGDNFFNVCWWGTYIPLHGLENLIKAFSFIQNNKIKLYIFGDSDKKSEPYRALIDKFELNDKVTIINDHSFSNGKLAPFLKKNCDIAVGNFGPSEKARTVLVNKLVDAISLGIPCLTMRTYATAELFPNDEGLIISESIPESIAIKIEECFQKGDALAAIGEAGKLKYFELFSPDVFKVKLLDLIQER